MSMLTFLPEPAELATRVRALPAARPLIPRLRGASGVHLVGGAVRDLLLGGAPVDLDLAVEGDAEEFAASLGGELKVHDRFGTSTVTPRRLRLRHRPDAPRNVREARGAPGRRAGAAGRGSPPPGLHGQRDRARARGRRSGRARGGAPGARGPRGPQAPGPARPELHRRPHAPVPARPIREPSRVRDRAAHASAGDAGDTRGRGRHGQRATRRRRAEAAGARARSGAGARGSARSRARCRGAPGVRPRGPGPRRPGAGHSSPATRAGTGSCWRWRRARCRPAS